MSFGVRWIVINWLNHEATAAQKIAARRHLETRLDEYRRHTMVPWGSQYEADLDAFDKGIYADIGGGGLESLASIIK